MDRSRAPDTIGMLDTTTAVGQEFGWSGSYGFQQPMLVNAPTSDSTVVPLAEYIDDVNGDFWDMTTWLEDPEIGPGPLNADADPGVFHWPS